jgi:hypothetical protein
MNLSEEQIKDIEQMAELFYSPEEIAINIEVDADEFKAQILAKSGAPFTAYMSGFFRGDMQLRKGIAQAAANGSNPAQQMLREIQKQNKISL